MKIETLATGDEVVCGDVVDSNSAYVSKKLLLLGIPTTKHQCVGDDLNRIESEILAISSRAQACVVIGGLGPTEDDLTARAAARASGSELSLNEEAVDRMKKRAIQIGLRFSEKNIQSAMIPKSARVLQTEVGTAPGFQLRIGQCEFFFFPGPPNEFRFFVDQYFVPWIQTQKQDLHTVTKQYKTLGWAEAHLAEKFDDFAAQFPEIKVGYRVHAPEVWLKLTAQAATREQALRALEPAEKLVYQRVGTSIFGQDHEELPALVHQLLQKSGLGLSAAESCTGGLLSSWLTAYPGSSSYFAGSVVSYANSAKNALLNVPENMLTDFGAVSPQVAQAMAVGARNQFQTDLAIAITGIAGPSGGSAEKPVGLVYLALASATECVSLKRSFRGDRARVQRASALTALEMIRRAVLKLEPLKDGNA